jgi:hypothetical protein
MCKGKSKPPVIWGVILGASLSCATASAQLVNPVNNAVVGPLPPQPIPPNEVKLTPEEQLGKFMLYGHTLSNPPGYACATCHDPEAGFTGPSSLVNEFGGPQPGVVPGRFGNRKPQSYVYAAFAPVGPVFNANLGVWIGGDFWDGRVPDLSTQAEGPPINPNEMNNTPEGPFPPLAGGFSPLVAEKLKNRPYTSLLRASIPSTLKWKSKFSHASPTPEFSNTLRCFGPAACKVGYHESGVIMTLPSESQTSTAVSVILASTIS